MKLPAVGGYITSTHFLAQLLEAFQRTALCYNKPAGAEAGDVYGVLDRCSSL